MTFLQKLTKCVILHVRMVSVLQTILAIVMLDTKGRDALRRVGFAIESSSFKHQDASMRQYDPSSSFMLQHFFACHSVGGMGNQINHKLNGNNG